MSDRPADWLRRSFAALDEGECAQPRCPAPEAIWDTVHAGARAGEARDVIEHIAACPSCAADWRLAMRSPDRPTAAAVATAIRPRWGFRSLVPLAAAAVLLVAVGWRLVLGPWGGPPAYRMPARVEIGSLVADGEPLDPGQFILRWSPAPEGTRYSVRVSGRQLDHLAGAEALQEPRYQVPPEALSRLRHGDLVLWQVEAVLPDGQRFVSETFTARLK